MSGWWRRGGEALLDAAVPLSFGGPGFRLRQRGFADPTLDVDLSGKRMVVTGASGGLGEATASMLLARGAQVVAVARNPTRLEASRQRLLSGPVGRGATLTAELADLSLLESTRALGARIAAGGPVDVLVNNAGVLLDDRTRTAEGLETAFATNVVSGFLLTRLLADRLSERAGRVINVTSGGMYTVSLDLVELEGNGPTYDGVRTYAQHKRAQVVLTEQWAARLAPRGVRVDACHPGWADTPGVQTSLPRFERWLRPLLRSAEEGADTIAFLACTPDLDAPSGSLFFDRRARRKTLSSGPVEPADLSAALFARLTEITSA